MHDEDARASARVARDGSTAAGRRRTPRRDGGMDGRAGGGGAVSVDGATVTTIQISFVFLCFLCGRNELVSVLAMYSDAPERGSSSQLFIGRSYGRRALRIPKPVCSTTNLGA